MCLFVVAALLSQKSCVLTPSCGRKCATPRCTKLALRRNVNIYKRAISYPNRFLFFFKQRWFKKNLTYV